MRLLSSFGGGYDTSWLPIRGDGQVRIYPTVAQAVVAARAQAEST